MTRSAPPRPLLAPAVALVVGIAIADRWCAAAEQRFALVLAAGLCLAVVVAGASRMPWRWTRLLLLAGAALTGAARLAQSKALPDNHLGRVVTEQGVLTRLAGQVVTEPISRPAELRNPFLPYEPEPRTRFVLSARAALAGDRRVPVCGLVRVTLASDECDLRPGDEVIVAGRLYRPRGPRNPGDFDWALWSRRQNIYAAMFVENAELLRREPRRQGVGLHDLSHRLRTAARRWLFAPFDAEDDDQQRSLLDAIVLGRRSAPTPALNEAFLKTGAIHFLTVSGFHVGVLGASVWMFLRFALRRGPRSAAVITAGALIVYATIAEPNAPVFRATIMALLFCAARVTGRDFATHNWLPAAAIVLLMFDPQQMFRAGFQLSFLQVAVLVAFFPRLATWRPWRGVDDDPRARDADSYAAFAAKGVGHWLWGLLLVSALAWASSWPLVVYHFERFAPWAPLQALLISPMVIATILLGFATVLLGPLPLVGGCAAVALHATTDGLLRLVDVLGRLPGALLEVSAPPAAVVVLTYGLAPAALYAAREARRARVGGEASHRRFVWLLAATIATLAIPGSWWFAAGALREHASSSALRLCVLDVGNGSANLIVSGDQTLLVDAGTLANFDAGETVRRALRALHAPDLTRCLISHANFDHFSGVPTLVDATGVRQVAVNPYFRDDVDRTSAAAKLLDELRGHTAMIHTLKRGDRLAAGASTIEVLWPPATGADRLRANDSSLVLRIAHPRGRVLLPGDIEREGISLLLDACADDPDALRAEVLIAPHHGDIEGDATAELLAAVDPVAIIVSTGRDRSAFAALARETLGNRVRVYSTRTSGAVIVEFVADRPLRISTPFAAGDD